jgi:hypothetical protein
VARSTSLITFANGAVPPAPRFRESRIAYPGAADCVAYFRDDESPSLTNLLRLIDELAPGQPDEVPDDSVLLAAQGHFAGAGHPAAASR